MRYEIYEKMKQPPFARDFTRNSASAAGRFDYGHPYGNAHVWKDRADWLDRADRPQATRDAIADVLLAFNRKHNDIPEAIRSIERLRDPETLAVAGGQQAGLFTGPMLVIYKALTLIQTAKAAQESLGRTVVPVFWIAGEDHDWDEVNHTYVLTSQLAVSKLLIGKTDTDLIGKRTSVSRTPVGGQEWADAMAALESALPDTEFKPHLIKQLQDIAGKSGTLVDAFAKTMSMLFGKYGLVLLDSDDDRLREIEAPMFQELIRHNEVLNSAIQTGQLSVTESGYALQAEAAKDGLQLFMFHDGERKLLFKDGDRVSDRKSTVSLTMQELIRLAENEPSSLSNNALTRPLMQEYLLPTLATVLGPSEIAYWGVLKESFHAFGMRTPVIVPRLEFTLLEGTVQKQMDKFGLTFEDAVERLEQRRDDWLREQDELGLEARFAQTKEAFRQLYAPLVETVSEINPGLRKLGETNMGKILEQIDFLESRSLEAHKSQHEAALRQWERVRLSVAPGGKPQERVYNVFQYALKYGLPWLDGLIGHPFIDFSREPRSHFVIYL
ncbi:bacillithiol biosynthesis cysteine-adding enzyme BshC [Paenibacillus alkalitolerans]|uniref:bacillithiol biosynthesis cysteine-adding enzyme BshC n=1 Tax=Paenibacillus alkalitolerans TaxID=2799335 RepID=UPI0018F33E12|nr:bacillithiol biosynthesis cysteine-adding enzyme BshC [Paenibacillus alkalitolerans]